MAAKTSIKKYRNWKTLSEKETRKIMETYNAGVKRNEIMRRYEITEGQLCRLIIEDANKKETF